MVVKNGSNAARLHFLRHAGAVVFDGDDDNRPGDDLGAGGLLGGDRDVADAVDCITRVQEQVQQHLTELAAVGGDDALVRRMAHLDVDARRERPHDELDHLVDDGPEVEATCDASFLPAEQQELPHEVGAVIGGLLDPARVLARCDRRRPRASRSPTRS